MATRTSTPTREIGPREEPEEFPTRFILNDGRWSEAEHEALLRKAVQAWNYRDMNRELEDAVQREKEAHELRLCVFFLMSMQLSVRMIPLWLQDHSQSSR